MTDLSGDAFVSALQSDNVKLLVGPAEEITIAKDLLIMKSQTMSKLIEKDGSKHLPAKLLPQASLISIGQTY